MLLCWCTGSAALSAKCQGYLPLMISQPRDLRFERDLYLSWAVSSDPSGYWAHTRGCRASPWPALTIYCTNGAIKGMLCACARLSQSVNSSGFCRRSPQWSFLAVQNNFLGWLYAICCQFKLQLCAQMGPKQPQKQRGAHDASTAAGRIEASVTRSCVASSSNW